MRWWGVGVRSWGSNSGCQARHWMFLSTSHLLHIFRLLIIIKKMIVLEIKSLSILYTKICTLLGIQFGFFHFLFISFFLLLFFLSTFLFVFGFLSQGLNSVVSGGLGLTMWMRLAFNSLPDSEFRLLTLQACTTTSCLSANFDVVITKK